MGAMMKRAGVILALAGIAIVMFRCAEPESDSERLRRDKRLADPPEAASLDR